MKTPQSSKKRKIRDDESDEESIPQNKIEKKDVKQLLKPGNLVLTKCGSHAWWPSMVITDSMVTHLLENRPKGERTWPVRFFEDNSFYFPNISQIKLFSKEEANKALGTWKNKKGAKLKKAYKYAANGPDLNDIYRIIYSTDMPPSVFDEWKEQNPDNSPQQDYKTYMERPSNSNDDESGEGAASNGVARDPTMVKVSDYLSIRNDLNEHEPLLPPPQYRQEIIDRSVKVKESRKILQAKLLNQQQPLSDEQTAQDCVNVLEELVSVPVLDKSLIKGFKLDKVMKLIIQKCNNMKIDDREKMLFKKFKIANYATDLLKQWGM